MQFPIGIDLALARLGIAIVLSLMFGLVRQLSGKPIGFGTFTFVSVGACALALTAVRLTPDNPLALLGATVTGVGFLGAGALVRTSDRISGFTSAATIWIMAVLGLTIGVGEYLISGLLYLGIWLVVVMDTFMERRGLGVHRRVIAVTVKEGVSLRGIRELFGSAAVREIESLSMDAETGYQTAVVAVAGGRAELEALAISIGESDSVTGFRLD